jgi:beta-N-acetylhexosaminidase
MPGHGRTSVDTHKALPRVTASAAELESDLAPFIALRDTPIGMTGHLVFEAWDADHPATQSAIVVEQIIRQRIGFDGLLLTDDLDMEALSGTVPERAEASFKAEVDIALNCWGKMADMTGICERAPVMSDVVKTRLDRALTSMGTPSPSDEQAGLLAKRDALFALLGAAEARA